MRVIAGNRRGKKLLTPKAGALVRPTSDRVKEALFNIIGSSVYDSYFLDLFCGSGAVGIEALSRGAKKAVFADWAASSLTLAEKNLQACQFPLQAYHLVQAPANQAISLLAQSKDRFDFIFLDPPYEYPDYETLLAQIARTPLLNEKGRLILETDRQVNLPADLEGLNQSSRRLYASTCLWFYERTSDFA